MQGAHLCVVILGAITTGIVDAGRAMYDYPCQSNKECPFKHSYCSREFEICAYHRCRCLPGYEVGGGGYCRRKVHHGMRCTHDRSVCIDRNTECKGEISTCQCEDNFEAVRNLFKTQCKPRNNAVIGEECDTVNECYVDDSASSSVECVVNDGTSSPKYCRCKAGYKELTDRYGCELPTLGETCVTAVGCDSLSSPNYDSGFDASPQCVDNICQCSDGYYEIMHPKINSKTFRKMCISNYTGELTDNGRSCYKSAHCESKLCILCNNYDDGVCAVKYPMSHADRKWPAGSLLLTMLLVLKALWYSI